MARRGVRLKPEFRKFFDGYVVAALWSSTDESDEGGGRPLDDNYNSDDLSRAAVKEMKKDCASFMHHHRRDLESYADLRSWGDAGHDFWLTRNGHGAGFWDRGLGALGDRLSKACKPYGSQYLYVGDDGKIHVG